MTPEEGKRFLAGEGRPYVELHFENERAYWEDVTLCPGIMPEGEEPVTVLRILSPNGKRHLDLQFLGSDFLDLWFGGFSYELFDMKMEYLERELRSCIRAVTEKGAYCTVGMNLKHRRWQWEYLWTPEEDGSLAGYLRKLRRPRTLWERIFHSWRLYEVYDWNEYHRIER